MKCKEDSHWWGPLGPTQSLHPASTLQLLLAVVNPASINCLLINYPRMSSSSTAEDQCHEKETAWEGLWLAIEELFMQASHILPLHENVVINYSVQLTLRMVSIAMTCLIAQTAPFLINSNTLQPESKAHVLHNPSPASRGQNLVGKSWFMFGWWLSGLVRWLMSLYCSQDQNACKLQETHSRLKSRTNSEAEIQYNYYKCKHCNFAFNTCTLLLLLLHSTTVGFSLSIIIASRL